MMYGCVCDSKYKMPKITPGENNLYNLELPNGARLDANFPCSLEVLKKLVDKINELQTKLNELAL